MLSPVTEMGMGKLADACLILRPSIVGIIARMEELGLVRRRADGRDKRRAQISLTPKGQALVATSMPSSCMIFSVASPRMESKSLRALCPRSTRVAFAPKAAKMPVNSTAI